MSSKSKVVQIAKALSMCYAKRHVNIRGYVVEVTCLDCKPNKDDEYRVQVVDTKVIERVPSHLFYHQTLGGLILRGSLEFERLYLDHPIGCINTPDYHG